MSGDWRTGDDARIYCAVNDAKKLSPSPESWPVAEAAEGANSERKALVYGGTIDTCGVLHSHVIPCQVAHGGGGGRS